VAAVVEASQVAAVVDEGAEEPIVVAVAEEEEEEESPVAAAVEASQVAAVVDEDAEEPTVVAVVDEEEEEEAAVIGGPESPTIVVEVEGLPLRRVSLNDDEYEYDYSDPEVPKAALSLSESVVRECGPAPPRTPAILRAMRGGAVRNRSRSVIDFEVAQPVQRSVRRQHSNRRAGVPSGSHDEAIRQLRELDERLGEQNVRLRAQLEASKKREASSQASVDFEYDVIIETIEKTVGIPPENIELDKKLRKLEGKLQRAEMNLTALQGRVVRKVATCRRLRVIRDELAELQAVSGIANRENLNRIVAMNETIQERRRRLATLEARIDDLRHLIDIGQRQMSVKTRAPRTDVINRVEELRVHRLIDRDNMRMTAMHEAEIKCLDARIREIKDTYGEERIGEMAAENERLQKVCQRLKKKFYASRAVRDENQQTLTSDSHLEMMQNRIEQLHRATQGEKKRLLAALGIVEKQMRALAELRIEMPPPPACYEELVQTGRTRSGSTIRIQK
jgi:hypothetical protein